MSDETNRTLARLVSINPINNTQAYELRFVETGTNRRFVVVVGSASASLVDREVPQEVPFEG